MLRTFTKFATSFKGIGGEEKPSKNTALGGLNRVSWVGTSMKKKKKLWGKRELVHRDTLHRFPTKNGSRIKETAGGEKNEVGLPAQKQDIRGKSFRTTFKRKRKGNSNHSTQLNMVQGDGKRSGAPGRKKIRRNDPSLR